jgi:hypothetical protein
MAEKIKQNQFDEVGVNPFNAPIPGESLTASPDTPRAWERPPQYTEQDEAMMAVYMELTRTGTLKELIKIIDEGIPLDEIAQVILYKGYTEGKFTPDMMLMLAEPTIYLLIAIADYADISDYVLYNEEDEDEEGAIPGDDVEPINMDEDEEEVTRPKIEPREETVGSGLLARIKKELPTKVEEAKEDKTEEEEV